MIVTEAAGMTWQVAQPHARVYKPSVAINIAAGKLTISRGATNACGDPDHVRLLYSAEQASIGIMPTTAADELGYTIIRNAGTKPNGKPVGMHHQTLSQPFCRMLAAAGHRGTIVVPLQWHPDGLLWGDLTMATQAKPRGKRPAPCAP